MNEIRSLTALRGIAALWVFGFHLWLWDMAAPVHAYADTPMKVVFRHGWTGVDLFFVLSGFVLTKVHPTLSVSDSGPFFVRRAFRVYPLHFTVTLALAVAVGAATLLGLHLPADRYDWKDLPAALLLLADLIPVDGRWNLVTWSLSVELVCYALLPLLLPRLRRLSRGALLLIGLALAAVASIWIVELDGPALGLPAVVRGMLGFYLGCCVALAWDAPRRAGLWAAAALVAIVAACALDLPGLIPLCTAILVGALSVEHGMVSRALRTAPLVWLGRVSFSIYLVHVPVITIMERLLPAHRLPFPLIGAAALRDMIVLGLVLALSALTFRFVEEPGRRLGRAVLPTPSRREDCALSRSAGR